MVLVVKASKSSLAEQTALGIIREAETHDEVSDARDCHDNETFHREEWVVQGSDCAHFDHDESDLAQNDHNGHDQHPDGVWDFTDIIHPVRHIQQG